MTGIALLFVLVPKSARRRSAVGAIAWFAGIAIADDLLLALPSVLTVIRLPGFDYNWAGKFLSLALGLASVYLLRIVTPSEAGWTSAQRPGSVRPAAIAVGSVLLLEMPLFWLMIDPAVPTIEDHVFQLTMPGLSEELMYRGVLLALADRAAPPQWRVLGANMGWGAMATAVLFRAVHAVRLNSDWSVSVNWMAGLLPLLGGFVFAWLRAGPGASCSRSFCTARPTSWRIFLRGSSTRPMPDLIRSIS